MKNLKSLADRLSALLKHADEEPYEIIETKKAFPNKGRWVQVSIEAFKFKGPLHESVSAFLQDNGFKEDSKNGYWYTKERVKLPLIRELDKILDPKHESYQKYTAKPKPEPEKPKAPEPDGNCWQCKSPEGYFRNYGPATPVRCDECEAKHENRPRAKNRY